MRASDGARRRRHRAGGRRAGPPRRRSAPGRPLRGVAGDAPRAPPPAAPRPAAARSAAGTTCCASSPGDEEAHVALMARFADAGDRYQALRQYDRLDRTLRAELGVRPGPSGRRHPRPRSWRPSRRAAAAPVLVGRDAELAAIELAMDDVADRSRRRSWCSPVPPGSGKSALLRAARRPGGRARMASRVRHRRRRSRARGRTPRCSTRSPTSAVATPRCSTASPTSTARDRPGAGRADAAVGRPEHAPAAVRRRRRAAPPRRRDDRRGAGDRRRPRRRRRHPPPAPLPRPRPHRLPGPAAVDPPPFVGRRAGSIHRRRSGGARSSTSPSGRSPTTRRGRWPPPTSPPAPMTASTSIVGVCRRQPVPACCSSPATRPADRRGWRRSTPPPSPGSPPTPARCSSGWRRPVRRSTPTSSSPCPGCPTPRRSTTSTGPSSSACSSRPTIGYRFRHRLVREALARATSRRTGAGGSTATPPSASRPSAPRRPASATTSSCAGDVRGAVPHLARGGRDGGVARRLPRRAGAGRRRPTARLRARPRPRWPPCAPTCFMALGDPAAVGAYREALELAAAGRSPPAARPAGPRRRSCPGDLETADAALDGLALDGGADDGEILLAQGYTAFFSADFDGAGRRRRRGPAPRARRRPDVAGARPRVAAGAARPPSAASGSTGCASSCGGPATSRRSPTPCSTATCARPSTCSTGRRRTPR